MWLVEFSFTIENRFRLSYEELHQLSDLEKTREVNFLQDQLAELSVLQKLRDKELEQTITDSANKDEEIDALKQQLEVSKVECENLERDKDFLQQVLVQDSQLDGSDITLKT